MKTNRRETGFRTRRPKILAALLSLWMILILAGCGQSMGAAEGDGGSAAGEEASASELSFAPAAGSVVYFETTDLEGNEVNSRDLFASHQVTMINVWATFCGPCVGEMPQLEQLHQELAKQDAGLVGVVLDVPTYDDALLEDAKTIAEQTGVTYQSLRAWEGCNKSLPAPAVPMTYFVDSEGKILGDPVVGADLDGYRQALEQYLQ